MYELKDPKLWKSLTEAERDDVRRQYYQQGGHIPPVDLAEFQEIRKETAKDRNQRVLVSLRLPEKTRAWWKCFGKGYTTVMAQVLDKVRNYPDIMKKLL